MTPGKFLRLVWPDTGFYCIAYPFEKGGVPTIHRVYPTLTEAVTKVNEELHSRDIYFAVLSLEQAEVPHPTKVNDDGTPKRATRLASNMHAAKAVFFDLDVGEGPGKYPTQRDAMVGLAEFLARTQLPEPMIVSSGGGLHVYWLLTESIAVAIWDELATHMRQLAGAVGLMVDPTRTTDRTSVLRVAGTFNYKRGGCAPVEVRVEAEPSTLASLKQRIADAMVRNGVVPQSPTVSAAPRIAVDDHGLGQQGFNDFGPPPTLEELGDVCGQVREIVRAQLDPTHPNYGSNRFDNNAWYRGLMQTFKHLENGPDLCRQFTAMHPRSNSDVEAKLVQLESYGPSSCEKLQQYLPWGDKPCQGCIHRDKVKNPFVAARRSVPAAPPVVGTAPPPPPPAAQPLQLTAPSINAVAMMIPNPPKPYERLKAGGIGVTRTDKDGNESKSVIFEHDLFPLKRLVNEDEKLEQQVWRVAQPRRGFRDFTIDADVLYDTRKFCVALSNNGVYPSKAEIPALQDYMVAYIAHLQKSLDGEAQATHLGWIDEYRSFVLPDKTLLSGGGVRASSLTSKAEKSTQFIYKRGDMAEQIKLLGFYNRPEYIANQSVIIDSLASILMHMTGQNGIVVNLSGDSGASKSTTLYTAAGLWADPKLWPINGTNSGATANARMNRLAVNASLPTFVDEITNMGVRDATDLVMGVTQPGHRMRLSQDGSEKKVTDSYKAAIMVTTANSSLHSLLSADNAAGTAGSMRVFEIKMLAQRVHTKAEADEFLRQIALHFGHIGEVFAQFVMQNYAAVQHRVHDVMRMVDTAAHIVSSERFWSARVAVGYVAAEIAQAIGLLPYAPEPILRWAVDDQIPMMRGIVKEEYRDPLAILTDYIAEKQGNIVVIDRSGSIGANTAGKHVVGETAFAVNNPHGALLGHFELKQGMLYILKQGFKDHCSRIGASSSRIIDDLSQARGPGGGRIIVNRAVRFTLGKGTQHAKGQAWCFAVDMRHPEVDGMPVAVPQAPANDQQQVA